MPLQLFKQERPILFVPPLFPAQLVVVPVGTPYLMGALKPIVCPTFKTQLS